MQFCGLLYVEQFWQCLHCIPCRSNHWTRLCKCIRLILSIPMAINLFVSPTWQSWISCLISWLPVVHCCHAVPARQSTSAPPPTSYFPQWIDYTAFSWRSYLTDVHRPLSVSMCYNLNGKVTFYFVLCCICFSVQLFCYTLICNWNQLLNVAHWETVFMLSPCFCK